MVAGRGDKPDNSRISWVFLQELSCPFSCMFDANWEPGHLDWSEMFSFVDQFCLRTYCVRSKIRHRNHRKNVRIYWILRIGEWFVNYTSCNIASWLFVVGSRVSQMVNRNEKGARNACCSPLYPIVSSDIVTSVAVCGKGAQRSSVPTGCRPGSDIIPNDGELLFSAGGIRVK